MNQYEHDVKTDFPHPGASNVQYCDNCDDSHVASNENVTYDEFESSLIGKGWKKVIEERIDFWYCPKCSNEKV